MSDTPRTLEVLTQILDRDGRLEEDNVPFVLVRLAKTLERELNAAKAEIAAMKKVIRKVYYETETCADGAPDATDHDKLCNEISSQLELYIK